MTLEQYTAELNEFISLNGQWQPNFSKDLPSKLPHQMTIGTLNVEWEGFDSIKKVNDVQGSGRPDYLNWKTRQTALNALIKNVDPDVLFLQELSLNQVKDFENSYNEYQISAVSANKGLILGVNKTKTADSLNNTHNQNFLGIMTGMMVKNTLDIQENGFFYLNSRPNFYPGRINPDIAYADEKFGLVRS